MWNDARWMRGGCREKEAIAQTMHWIICSSVLCWVWWKLLALYVHLVSTLVMSEPSSSLLFAVLPLPCIILNTNWKNKNPGNKARWVSHTHTPLTLQPHKLVFRRSLLECFQAPVVPPHWSYHDKQHGGPRPRTSLLLSQYRWSPGCVQWGAPH